MLFSVFSVVATLACAAFAAAQSASTVVSNLQAITQMSSDLNTVASSINVVNAPYQGPRVAQGLTDISNTVHQYITQMDNPPPVFPDSDAATIIDAVRTFVSTQQQLLSTLIGKHGILSLFFFTQPIHTALVQLESTVDAYALSLGNMVPSQAGAAQEQFGSFDSSIEAAINVYS